MSARPRTTRSRVLRRIIAGSAIAVIALPLAADAASAHIAVATPDAVRGGEVAELSFRVPDESDKASTVKVRIDLPVDAPVAEVKARRIPGWSATIASRKLPSPTKVGDFTLSQVPASITWTAAAGAAIAPGEFQVFGVMIAPVPDVASLTFAAVQTYSDGTVVTWNQPEAADGSEAEFPAPVLDLSSGAVTASPTASPSVSASPSASLSVTASEVAQPTSSDAGASDPTARVLGGLAVVLGLGALVTALVGRRA